MERIKFVLAAILASFFLTVHGQNLSSDDVLVKWRENEADPRLVVVDSVINKSGYKIIVDFTNEYDNTKSKKGLNLKEGERRKFGFICNKVEARVNGGNKIKVYEREKLVQIETAKSPKPTDKAANNQKTVEKTPAASVQASVKETDTPKAKTAPVAKKGPLGIDDIVPDFVNYIETIPVFSAASIERDGSAINEHINNLKNWKNKEEYIGEHRLASYVKDSKDSVEQYANDVQFLIADYLDRFDGRDIENKKECRDSLQNLLMSRLEQRKANINRLSDAMANSSSESSSVWKNLNWKNMGIGLGLLLLLIALFVWFKKANKKNGKPLPAAGNVPSVATDPSTAIIVRRKTTSILRKQSLEDVIDNGAYYKIDCNEFCDDSAVRRIYIKNTCIKDIYNMYAEDLRNPNNPKEDGCMVLGRWVYDAENNEYYVSLEHIVLPGDDAVFAEYELNFGGKIKLKVTEKLRKLRRDTNLQYDLTCWVHSHPGLGVFFSNSDSNVQMQLKHPTHPNFLTAIVVDILTPQQEMGIFTFKRDASINSKADLKKMYSLEELYKWAVESDRSTFKAEDYYNILADAMKHDSGCSGIELSNSAIIDMEKLVVEEPAGFLGMVHGYTTQQGLVTEYVANAVAKNESVPGNELVGCFLVSAHCSIPSIRKAIAGYINNIKFVLVYTTVDGLLTSIPIINQDICTDENYYGEQKFEELKIWTRRKR